MQVFGDLCVVSYWIDTLVLKLRKILTLLLCTTLSSSREKLMQAQEVSGRISSAVPDDIYAKSSQDLSPINLPISGTIAGEIYAKSSHTKYPS